MQCTNKITCVFEMFTIQEVVFPSYVFHFANTTYSVVKSTQYKKLAPNALKFCNPHVETKVQKLNLLVKS